MYPIRGPETTFFLAAISPISLDPALMENRGTPQQLRTLWEKKNALNKLIQQVDDLSILSEDERELYRERKSRLEDRLQNLGRSKERQETLSREARRLVMKIKEKQEEIYRQEERVQLSQQARRKVDVTTSLRSLFRGFRDQLKSLRRGELEEAINKRFRSLMKSHGLVDRIEVDADFGLHYKDNTGEPVGMANLSTGMKQLAATSLLWALKEVSGRPVPVVIDTPLARMDRVHQENLLKQYYPKAGHQVIVLPTDAELDRDKYSLLTPYIYREYRLENPKGNRTIIVRAPMYDLNEENPHA
jgi:DNA sulfur modification protein DndD